MDLLAHIRIFVAIADHGSLAAVSRAQSQSPSAVTAALQRLEAHVGARLVLRSTRRLSLTPEGERFLADCRRILTEVEDALDHVGDRGPLKGVIRLTAVNDFGRSRLPGLIDGFIRRHPGVRVDLSLGDEITDLIQGGYDLAIRTGPLSDSRLVAKRLMRGGRSVCAAPAYWLHHGRPDHPRDLADHNCLVLARSGDPQNSWQFRDGNNRFSVQVAGDRTANDGGLLRAWAIAGAGVVLKSDYDVQADIAAGRLETVLEAFRDEDVNLYAVHPAGRQPARRVQAFMDYLYDALSPA